MFPITVLLRLSLSLFPSPSSFRPETLPVAERIPGRMPALLPSVLFNATLPLRSSPSEKAILRFVSCCSAGRGNGRLLCESVPGWMAASWISGRGPVCANVIGRPVYLRRR